MNVTFLPGFAVVIPRPVAVVFAAQVELSLIAPAFWMTSSILLLVRVFMAKKERERDHCIEFAYFTFFSTTSI